MYSGYDPALTLTHRQFAEHLRGLRRRRRNGLGDGEEDYSGIYESAPESGAVNTGGGLQWGRFFQDLIKEGVSITRAVVTPPTVRRNADGSLQIRSTTPPSGIPASVGVGVGVPGWVWVAGGLGLVLVAVSASKRGNR